MAASKEEIGQALLASAAPSATIDLASPDGRAQLGRALLRSIGYGPLPSPPKATPPPAKTDAKPKPDGEASPISPTVLKAIATAEELDARRLATEAREEMRTNQKKILKLQGKIADLSIATRKRKKK